MINSTRGLRLRSVRPSPPLTFGWCQFLSILIASCLVFFVAGVVLGALSRSHSNSTAISDRRPFQGTICTRTTSTRGTKKPRQQLNQAAAPPQWPMWRGNIRSDLSSLWIRRKGMSWTQGLSRCPSAPTRVPRCIWGPTMQCPCVVDHLQLRASNQRSGTITIIINSLSFFSCSLRPAMAFAKMVRTSGSGQRT